MDDPPVDAAVQRLDNQHPALFGQTPSQTVGPFFHYALPWNGCADLIGSSQMGARPDLFAERHYAMRALERAGRPVGEAIEIAGRVLDASGDPVPDAMVEIWQANAAGRYWHDLDRHPAPLDPNFRGVGRCMTDAEGRYRFITIRPGSYPWGNHFNAWRPAHVHFSLFGRAFTQRLVTQMYFPADPMFAHDPIFNAVRDRRDRERLICSFDFEATTPEWALGYRFDIVLRGREATPFEESHR